MAVFGFQLLLTIIVLSILNKLSPKYSFARWILTKGGLIRYLHPTNEQLKQAIQQSKNDELQQQQSITGKNSNSINQNNHHQRKSYRKNRRNHHQEEHTKPETFYVPKDLRLMLDSEPLTLFNLVQLPYYNELQWLIDFSISTVLVYFLTESYYTFIRNGMNDEYNLSIVWCLLSLGFVMKILCSITATYFRGEESIGERSICIVCFCIYLLVAMIILIADEETLEFGLLDAYRNFSTNAYHLLQTQGVIENAYGPSSFLMIKFWLAIICGLIGALFAFPGLRIAQMHFDSLVYSKGNQFLTIMLHLSFVSPLFICLAWIKPVARYYFVEKNSISSTTFESGRLILILAILMLRFCLFRHYLQSYLNIAPQKISYLRKQTGKITNIDIQKLIARVGHYLSVASLQYLTPLLLCLFLALLTKSTGDYRWTGTLWLSTNESTLIVNDTMIVDNTNNTSHSNSTTITNEDKTAEDVARLALTLLRDVFNPIVLRGFMGFLLWWTCSCWFFTSVVGFIYNNYFRI
ncbi:hypothetical protein DERP_007799 [Dermatophagoides pteronyssinus]|uniref:Transmembrane protein 161B-like n=1 Tax=Dermatophagoides pteronyssinus TaxID=6956 RepID=A0ABQ8ISR6_DERPT|nr:hypothetical protein DERP_007799 [Dermatophagoides pteronyssinus]